MFTRAVTGMVTKPGEPDGRPAFRFPVDPEPRRRSRRQPLTVLASVGILAAAVIIGVLLAGGGSPSHPGRPPAGLSGLRGRVVVQTTTGGIAMSDPDGSHLLPLPALGVHSQQHPPVAAPDGRFLALGDGVVIAVDRIRAHGGLSIQPTPVRVTNSQDVPWPDPFADGDRDLVLVGSALGAPGGAGAVADIGKVLVVSLATAAAAPLSFGDFVAGDPQEQGVFASVAVGVGQAGTASGSNQGQPDSRVERRRVGQPAVVLAAAAALNRDLGQDPATPVQLIPYPDPAGDKVAVDVISSSGGVDAGLVVLDRAGRLVGAIPPTTGPEGVVAWSPDGTRLAYATGLPGDSQLAVWTPGSRAAPLSRPFADPTKSVGSCLWSPDGSSVLCSTFDPATSARPTGWEIAPPGGAPLVAVAGGGVPFAWIAAPGEGSSP